MLMMFVLSQNLEDTQLWRFEVSAAVELYAYTVLCFIVTCSNSSVPSQLIIMNFVFDSHFDVIGLLKLLIYFMQI